MDDLNYQIEQCKLLVNAKKTREFYSELPRIKDNCQCGDCAYFEDVVLGKRMRLFEILEDLGVNLSRQPNINPDGVCSFGDTGKFKRSYLGYYLVFGKIRTIQEPSLEENQKGQPYTFVFNEEDSCTGLEIKQANENQLEFEFFIEIEKKHS